MPLTSVDANSRLHKVKAARLAQGAGNPASLSEALDLAPGEEFREKTTMSIANGNVKSKMVYFFQGIPVYDCHIVVEKNPNTGEFVGITFNYWTGLADALPTGDVISPEEALRIALEREGDLAKKDEIDQEMVENELQIYIEKSNMTARRMYQVAYFHDQPTPKRPTYQIDANTGEVLKNWNNMCSGFGGY